VRQGGVRKGGGVCRCREGADVMVVSLHALADKPRSWPLACPTHSAAPCEACGQHKQPHAVRDGPQAPTTTCCLAVDFHPDLNKLTAKSQALRTYWRLVPA
jgi:hypothetical protein